MTVTLRRKICLNIEIEREEDIIILITSKDLPVAGPLNPDTDKLLLEVPDWEVSHWGGEGDTLPLLELVKHK